MCYREGELCVVVWKCCGVECGVGVCCSEECRVCYGEGEV